MTAPAPIITGGDSPVTIPAGDIVFYDCFAPPLTSGQYTIEAMQTVTGVDDGPPPYQQTQALTINGPRFSLSATDISSRYPPANSVGAFPDHLPHIVLQQRTTPWSRTIVDPNYTPAQPAAPANTPWMALLDFYSADLQVPGNQQNPNPNAPVAPPVTGLVSDIFNKATNVLVPEIAPTAAEQGQQVVTIDVDYPFFLGIAPSQTDLPYLAHGRQVNTTGKALGGDAAQGFFSLAVCNRVVNSGDSNLPVLVSLEGHWNRLPGGSDATNSQYANYKIRLVVLASWSFTATPSPGDFLALMTALDTPPNGGTAPLALPSSGPTASPDTDPAAQAVEALALGYTPLPYDLRVGENTTGFFRGPLAAVPCATDTTYGPFYYSDSAIFYDPTFGTFNLGYAAAFQIGRLLALSDGAFAASLVRWRNEYFYRLQHSVQKQTVNAPLAKAVEQAAGPDSPPADTYGPPDEMRSIALRLWHGGIAAPVLQGEAKIPRARLRQVRHFSALHPGVLGAGEIARIHAGGEDPVEAIKRRLVAHVSSRLTS